MSSVRRVYSFMVVVDVEGTHVDDAYNVLDSALLDMVDIEREIDVDEQVVSFAILNPPVSIMDDVDLLDLEEDYTDDEEGTFDADPEAQYA